jgi:hypothetical protein
MKKIYIAPKIDVIILDTLCDATLQTCSVFKGKLNEECISHFDVVGEEQTKTGTDYKDLWGESNSANWGDD